MFQKRHYEFLADVLRTSSTRANSAHGEIVVEIANALARDNPRFNRTKFLEAAGVFNNAHLATANTTAYLERLRASGAI